MSTPIYDESYDTPIYDELLRAFASMIRGRGGCMWIDDPSYADARRCLTCGDLDLGEW